MEIKKFLKRLFFFSIPFLLLIPMMEFGLSTIPNSYNKKKKYFERQLDSIELLVLGSSHTVYSIDPAYLSLKGFNLANVNQSIYYDKELTLKYLAQMPRLKQVIIPISYFSMYYRVQDAQESWRAFFYDRIWHVKPRDRRLIDLAEYSYIKMYFPKSMLYTTYLFDVDLAPTLMSNGFMRNDTGFIEFLDTAGLGHTDAIFHSDSRAAIYKETSQDLEDMISELRKRNIKVSLITTPVLPAYSDHFDTAVVNGNMLVVRELCQKYDCKYYNYLNDSRFVKSDFGDYSHINYIGARKFSKILNKDVIDSLAP